MMCGLKAITELKTEFKHFHKAKQWKVNNDFYQSDLQWKVGEALCDDPSRWLRASSYFLSFSNGGNGPKGALNGESSSMVS